MRSSWTLGNATVTLPDGTVHERARLIMRARRAKVYAGGEIVAEQDVTGEQRVERRPPTFELSGDAGVWLVVDNGCGCRSRR